MAASAADTVSKFQAGLEQFIKPREQVNYIRRILALQLGSYTGHGPAVQPLSLVDNSPDVSASTQGLHGIQKEYARALQANVAARHQFDDALQASRLENNTQSESPPREHDLLGERLALVKLQQRLECLCAIQRSLDRFAEQFDPAQSSLDIGRIFNGAAALPGLPEAVVNGFVAEQNDSRPDLQDHVNQLKRTTLRAKLILKQEQRRLVEAKVRRKSSTDIVSNGAKLEALIATRNGLINWIEAELGKASAHDSEEISQVPRQEQILKPIDGQAGITAQLRQIHNKYAHYLAARKELLALVFRHSQPPVPPPHQQSRSTGDTNDTDLTSAIHLTPYVEALLSVSRHQKGVITHKSHVNSVLNKQNKNMCQALGRLADESQLLPLYPMKDSLRQMSGVREETSTKSCGSSDISTLTRPWVFSAEAAKIATLEAVAEAIEGGQVALENCMKSLQDIDHLLGQDTEVATDGAGVVEPPGEDVWLNSGEAKAVSARKRSEKTTGPRLRRGDPWSRLHGNLGFISHNDAD